MNIIHLSILGSASFSNILSELEFNNVLNLNNISNQSDKKILVKILFVGNLKIKGKKVRKKIQPPFINRCMIHLIERKGKLGLGTAYIAGFKWALARSYDFICEMDCDFSHNPKDLKRLIRTSVK
jgi:glycosyltransferase involved in cell wall biosynthesis